MAHHKNNIFAFPISWDNDNSKIATEHGMTLADYFAGQALSGLLSKYNLKTPEDQETISKMAYELAMEMLNQRTIQNG